MNGAMPSTNNSGNQSALFNHSNVSISGGTFILNHINSDQNTEAGLNRAFQEVVVAAMHDNNDLVEVPKCHPGTRTALIGGLIMRARDTDADRFLIWLVGPAGAGKSAIARSFAEEMDKAGIRFASFCFFRTDPGRNSVKGLIVTLAFQISNSIPEFKPYLRQAVADDATILRRSLSSQFEKLITLPLRQLLESSPSHNFILQPFLILVDGLDECVDRKSRCLFLQLVHRAIPTIPGLRFVFTSRPEEDIQTQFDQFGNEEYDKIELLANLSAYEDIRTFLGAEFKRIRTTHPLRKVLKDDWPSSHDIEDLLRKSSGHFIYPATAIKYIEYSLDNPQRSLQVILGLRTSSRKPLADLDALYSSILESSRAEPQTLRDILSVLIALSRSGSNWEILLSKSRKVDPVETTTHLIETLLGLEEGDTQLAFLDITSIIKHDSASATLSFHHRSFVDFLCDRSRSGPYFINLLPSFGLVIKNCLQVLSKPHTFFNAKSPNHLLKNTYHSIIMNCFETIHPEFPQFFIEIHDLFMSYKPLDADEQDFIKRKKFYAGQFLEICDFYKPHLNDDSLFKHHLAQLDASLISDIHMMSWPPVVTRHFLTLSILPDAFQSFHTDIPLDKYRNPEVLYKLFPALETLHPSLSLKYYSSPYFRQVGKFFFSKERAGSYWINEDSLVSATIWCIQNFLQVVDPMSPSDPAVEFVPQGSDGPKSSLLEDRWAQNIRSLLVRQIFRPVRFKRHLVFVPRVATVAQHLQFIPISNKVWKNRILRSVINLSILHNNNYPATRIRHSGIEDYSENHKPEVNLSLLNAQANLPFDASLWKSGILRTVVEHQKYRQLMVNLKEKEILVVALNSMDSHNDRFNIPLTIGELYSL